MLVGCEGRAPGNQLEAGVGNRNKKPVLCAIGYRQIIPEHTAHHTRAGGQGPSPVRKKRRPGTEKAKANTSTAGILV